MRSQCTAFIVHFVLELLSPPVKYNSMHNHVMLCMFVLNGLLGFVCACFNGPLRYVHTEVSTNITGGLEMWTNVIT